MSFDTIVLDTALARRRAARERERRRTLARLLRLLDDIGTRYDIDYAYLFGSITRPGQFRDVSDVDVAVETRDAATFFDLMSALSLALERDVDLVQLNKCHFAERIRDTGILWTKKPSRSEKLTYTDRRR